MRIVTETREPGASVRAAAARYDDYPNLLSTWRTLERRGRLASTSPTRFMPIHLIETAPPTAAHGQPTRCGRDHDHNPDGSRVRVGNDVSLAAFHRVMMALRG